MDAEQRLYRTDDGRLVAAGDPDAVELAYPAGAKVSKADEQLLAAAATEQGPPAAEGQEPDVPTEQPVDEPAPEPEPAPAPATKRRAKPADKSARPAADK